MTPRQGPQGPPVKPFRPPHDLKKRPRMAVVVTSERVFAVADYELLSDPFTDRPEASFLRNKVIEWLETE